MKEPPAKRARDAAERGRLAGYDRRTGEVRGSGSGAGGEGNPDEDYDQDPAGGAGAEPVGAPRASRKSGR